MKYIPVQMLFDMNTNTTGSSDLTVEMKTFYWKQLLKGTEPELVHDQFGQKRPIPANGGKTIEFRKYSSLPKATNPLTEGVTPDGQALAASSITATVSQYGGYITISDVLQLTAIDNNIAEATELIASQAGRTLDTVTREVLNGGTQVQYGEDSVDARYLLVGGESSGNHLLTVNAVKLAVRKLKKNNIKKIDGWYVCIIHPDAEFDLTSDDDWKKPHEYVDTKHIYEGEIGELFGVRFVATTEAKIFSADNLTAAARDLSIKSVTNSVVTCNEAISASEATALVGRYVIIGSEKLKITASASGAAESATITLASNPSTTTASTKIYPGEAGAKGRNIYSSLFLGANAYGITDVNGGGLQHIVKPLGSGGTADPLNQRATVGWKALKTAVRLMEEGIVRVETATSFNDISNN